MPSFEETLQYLTGAWRMMLGKANGLRLLDLSADGFWNSFFAMVISLPALGVGWVSFAHDLTTTSADVGGRLSILVRLAVIDAATWIVPLAALAAVASRAGIADRFVAYVVASNWGTALVAWLMLPPPLIKLFVPDSEFAELLALAIFVVFLGLSWRLTNVAIGKGAAVASAVFAGTFIVSLAVYLTLQQLLGLMPIDQVAG